MGAAAELFIKISADAKAAIKGFAGAEKAAQDLGKGVNAAAGEYSAAASKIDAASSSMAASAKGVGDAARGVGGAMGDAGKKASMFGDIFKGAFAGAIVADFAMKSISAFTGQITNAFNALARIEQINAQTSAAIASTGGAANVTAAQIAAYSGAIERKTGVEAESVQIGQNLLLTFTAIQNKTGEGNQIFDRATDAMVNLSVAMGTDTKSAAMQLGKALQDPTKGMDSLRRSGFSFSEAQRETVKALDASGKRMEAQKLILAELERQFGSSAEAFGKTLPGAIIRAEHALTSLTEAMLMPAIPYITNAMGMIAERAFDLAEALAAPGGSLVSAFNAAFGPEVKAGIIGIGAAMTGALAPAILSAGRAFLAAAAAAAPFIATAAAVGFTAYAIMQNWDVLRGFWIMTMEAMGAGVTWLRNQVSRIFGDVGQIVGDTMMYIGLMVRETLGEDVTAKLGIGLAKASEIMRSFGQVAAETIAPIGAGLSALAGAARDNMITTWGGAFDSARSVYAQLTAETQDGSVKMAAAINQATGATAAAGKTAKETAAQKKELAKAMADAAERAQVYYGALVNVFRLYQRQAAAVRTLNVSMRALDAQAEKQGAIFDANAAKAKLYQDALGNIQRAFGASSPAAQRIQDLIDVYSFFSENFTAKTAAAAQAVQQAEKEIEQARVVAQALGEEFDEGAKTAEAYGTALQKAVEAGLRPGSAELDKIAEKARTASTAQKDLSITAAGLIGGYVSVSQAFETVTSETLKMAEAMGVDVTDGMGLFLAQGVSVVSRAAEIATSIGSITGAVTGLVSLFAQNPILGLIATGLAVIGVAGAFILDQYMKANREAEEARRIALANDPVMRAYADQQVINNQRIADSYRMTNDVIAGLKKTTIDAVTAATFAFMAGSADWAKDLEFKLKEAMFKGLMDKMIFEQVTKKFEKDFEAIGEAVMQGNDKLAAQLTAKVAKNVNGMIKPLAEAGKELLKGFDFIQSDAQRAIENSMDKARQAKAGADAASAAAMQMYISAQTSAITALRNQGATWEDQRIKDALLAIDSRGSAFMKDLNAPKLAAGGVVTGPTFALVGEGSNPEAVLPLTDSVYRQIASGIAAQGTTGAGVVVNVNYTGNGKWTREDAQGLGRMMVAELRALGVR